MRRRVLNGVLGGLAALAALYAIGTIGLLVEHQTGRGGLSPTVAFLGLVIAAGFGFFVLQRLSRQKNSPSSPIANDSAIDNQHGDRDDPGGGCK